MRDHPAVEFLVGVLGVEEIEDSLGVRYLQLLILNVRLGNLHSNVSGSDLALNLRQLFRGSVELEAPFCLSGDPNRP